MGYEAAGKEEKGPGRDPLQTGPTALRGPAGIPSLGRFADFRFLGRGGMGEVYRVYDEKLKIQVALKHLTTLNPNAITRFRREFRTLTNVIHPNLLRLYEFFEANGHFFFTMELVRGTNFLEYVKASGGEGVESSLSESSLPDPVGLDPETAPDAVQQPAPIAPPDYDPDRLRHALPQLVHGLMALHEAGVIHRDIKPSNIIVDSEGKLLILDFGLAIPADIESSLSQGRGDFVGTVSYMAPEQAANKKVTPAVDWYAVGVLLYRTITGRMPFSGSVFQILVDKQRHEPPPPREVVREVDEDLDKLCEDLLRFDPEARPDGPEVLRRLGATPSPVAVTGAPITPMASSTQGLFLGRDSEMRLLDEALGDVEPGKPVAVIVSGESGVGKTMLMNVFAEKAARASSDTLVLKGRCYEKEAVPFKALDGIMERLSRELKSMPDVDVAALMPLHAGFMTQAFPVLRRLPILAKQKIEEIDISPHEQRQRLFSALREFFIRLARKKSVVLLIDDLQWADVDSKALLHNLLLPPEAPGLLLVATYRGTQVEDIEIPGDVRHIHIRELPTNDARQLIERLLDQEQVAPDAELIDAIAEESQGHPLFIAELVRHVASSGQGTSKAPGLDEVLWHRIGTLDPATKHLLLLICTSGKPTGLDILKSASNMIVSTLQRQVDVLRAGQLIRSRQVRDALVVEPYHDRIRESVVNHLSEEQRRSMHRHLALALQDTDDPDLEALVDHWRMAGSPKRAAHFARMAGDKAMSAFAFEHAVYYYQFALEHHRPDDSPGKSKLYQLLGSALTNAGRGKDAADAYLAAIEGAPEERHVELKRAAAGQLLRSGYLHEGIRTLREVMDEVGIKYHKNTGSVIAGFLWTRFLLGLRRTRFHARSEDETSRTALVRLDTYWDTAMCFSMVDSFRGSYYSSRLVLEALDVGLGEPLSMALALEAMYLSTYGAPAREKVSVLLKKAQDLLKKSEKPKAIFWATLAEFTHYVLMGQFQTAYELLPKMGMLLGKCEDIFWEISTSEIWTTWSLCHTGKFDELQKSLPRFLLDAEQRGDRYAVTNLTIGLPTLYWLVRDEPETARRLSDEVLARWDRRSFQLQDYYHMLSLAQIMLYQGTSPYELVESKWKALQRSQLLRIQLVKMEAFHLRARAALMEGELKAARRHAKTILKSKEAWAHPIARLVLAGVAASEGNQEEAVSLLRAIREQFQGQSMPQYVMATNWHLGGLLGGPEGENLRRKAQNWADSQGIRNWLAFVSMLAPGFEKSA